MDGLKEKLSRGEVAFGTHVSLNEPAVTELFGDLGFDYLWIDTEHTSMGLECLQSHLIAARATGTSAIVRVPAVDPIRVKPILEMGPDGIVFPQVNSYEMAVEAARSCMYPPKGIRGFGPRRPIRYGNVPIGEYLETADSSILKLMQFENVAAYPELDRILSIEDMDALIIGPCDLAASMGHLGDWRNEEVDRMIERVIEKTHAAGKRIGVSYGACSFEDILLWKRRGVDMISIAADTDYLLAGAKTVLCQLQKAFTMDV